MPAVLVIAISLFGLSPRGCCNGSMGYYRIPVPGRSQPSVCRADTITMSGIFSNETIKRKYPWLHEVIPYVYIIAGFLTIYLIHHANTVG